MAGKLRTIGGILGTLAMGLLVTACVEGEAGEQAPAETAVATPTADTSPAETVTAHPTGPSAQATPTAEVAAVPVDPCEKKGCMNGACSDIPAVGPVCLCDDGWLGDQCDTPDPDQWCVHGTVTFGEVPQQVNGQDATGVFGHLEGMTIGLSMRFDITSTAQGVEKDLWDDVFVTTQDAEILDVTLAGDPTSFLALTVGVGFEGALHTIDLVADADGVTTIELGNLVSPEWAGVSWGLEIGGFEAALPVDEAGFAAPAATEVHETTVIFRRYQDTWPQMTDFVSTDATLAVSPGVACP